MNILMLELVAIVSMAIAIKTLQTQKQTETIIIAVRTNETLINERNVRKIN
ncbi:hypothetical protein [Aphanothece sacrum]|uniref:hypothetical protein n=1 Tax=Aphanothece sacrum TaxID=1122 RepID=UPI0015622BEB|nr:hypothetical protein [Aphanothece sacrum]